jgi:hypothetical protein
MPTSEGCVGASVRALEGTPPTAPRPAPLTFHFSPLAVQRLGASRGQWLRRSPLPMPALPAMSALTVLQQQLAEFANTMGKKGQRLLNRFGRFHIYAGVAERLDREF